MRWILIIATLCCTPVFVMAQSAEERAKCEAVAGENAAALNALAAKGNSAGVQSLFREKGCKAKVTAVKNTTTTAGRDVRFGFRFQF